MKNCFSFVLFFLAALFPFSESRAQSEFVLVEQALPNPDNEPAPLHPLPTERQLAWHEVEFYAFFHYGLNTYTGQEWGAGVRTRLFSRRQRGPMCGSGWQRRKPRG